MTGLVVVGRRGRREQCGARRRSGRRRISRGLTLDDQVLACRRIVMQPETAFQCCRLCEGYRPVRGTAPDVNGLLDVRLLDSEAERAGQNWIGKVEDHVGDQHDQQLTRTHLNSQRVLLVSSVPRTGFYRIGAVIRARTSDVATPGQWCADGAGAGSRRPGRLTASFFSRFLADRVLAILLGLNRAPLIRDEDGA